MSQSDILDKIVNYAMSWNGVEELPGNMGWEDEEFWAMIEDVTNWKKGEPWCAYFVKVIFYKVFGHTEYGEAIQKNFTGSATQTFENCENDPAFSVDFRNEIAGSVAVWRKWNNGKPSWKGHIGIVIDPGAGEIGSHFRSIEGNTHPDDRRTGGMVGINEWRNNHDEKDGLVLEGFIFPPMPLYKLETRNIEL